MRASRIAALSAAGTLLLLAPAARSPANAGDPSETMPESVKRKTRHFGEQPAPGVVLAVLDGGTHGVAGHGLELRADGSARWTRRVDSVAPHAASGAGVVELSEPERERLAAWAEAAWELAQASDDAHYPPVEADPPRWVWAVVVRRGEAIRLLEGGGVSRDGAPPALRPLLEWLVERVDELAAKGEP